MISGTPISKPPSRPPSWRLRFSGEASFHSEARVVLKNALDHRRLQLENTRLRGDTQSKYRIIGESVPMKALRQQMTDGRHQRAC